MSIITLANYGTGMTKISSINSQYPGIFTFSTGSTPSVSNFKYNSVSYRLYTYTANGFLVSDANNKEYLARVLCVGCGYDSGSLAAGSLTPYLGGGAGGPCIDSYLHITPGTSYTITIGTSNGQTSTIYGPNKMEDISHKTGGYPKAGSSDGTTIQSPASATRAVNSGGTATTTSGGGGGSVANVGGNGTTNTGGNGANGYTWINGVTYAGGGGGSGLITGGQGGAGGGGAGGTNASNLGVAGTANTGGGGGASYGNNPAVTGGSGIVLIAIPYMVF